MEISEGGFQKSTQNGQNRGLEHLLLPDYSREH